MDIPIEERHPHLVYPMKAVQNMTGYLRALAARLRGLFSKRDDDWEFDEEIQAHVELLTERYIRQGMTRDEAASAARRQFGNVTLLKEENREMRGIIFIETFIQDLRYSARTLLKAPGFTLNIVITLALGIAVNTVILSMMNGFLLRGLAVEKPAELMSVFWGKKSDPQVWDGFSYSPQATFQRAARRRSIRYWLFATNRRIDSPLVTELGEIMQTLGEYLRYGTRTFLKNPGLTLIAAITLALHRPELFPWQSAPKERDAVPFQRGLL
jgi:hypothetical protein